MSETSRAGEPRPAGLVRGLGLLDATLLIVGSVIGSGIFFAPSIMAGYPHSRGLLLGLWVLGGLPTLAGALAYAELAAAMPRATTAQLVVFAALAGAMSKALSRSGASTASPSPARGWSTRWRVIASSSAARRACIPGTAPRRRPS